MTLSILVAMSENRVIGLDGGLPWRLPKDLRRVKTLSTGHVVIMGRRTFDSIGRPLPERTNVVITRQPDWSQEGVIRAGCLDEALGIAAADPRGGPGAEVFVLGGEAVYRLALPRTERIYLTLVHAEVEGDTFFPECDLETWRVVEEERHPADERHEHAFTFRTLEGGNES